MSRHEGRRGVLCQRVTRRTMLRGAVGGALGGASLAWGGFGCGNSNVGEVTPSSGSGVVRKMPGETATASPTVLSPRPGGTVNLCMSSQMTDLGAHVGSANGSTTNTFVHDHLISYDSSTGRYETLLAQSVENPDPLTYIFKIKPTAKFHNLPPVNGRQVTADDVIASWKAYVDNPRTGNKGLFLNVDHYETPDQATLVVKMKQPNAWALSGSGFADGLSTVVLPKEIVDKMDTVAVGAGAYHLEKFDPASWISFVKRPDPWHEPGRPYINRVTYQVITDPAARAAALKAKQIDSLVARDKLEADEFKNYGPDMQVDRELSYPSSIQLRADRDGWFYDPRIREAIYNAIDVKGLIDLVELGEGEVSGPLMPYLTKWVLPADELWKAYPHDVAKAKQLLAAGNWDFNREVELKYPADATQALFAEGVQRQLSAVGIRIRLVPLDSATAYAPQVIRARDYQMTTRIRVNLWKDPDATLRLFTTDGTGGGNYQRWSDPEVDAIVAKQAVEFDPEKQRQIIIDAQRLLLKKFAPCMFVYCPYVYTARWGYYHPATNTGSIGAWGHYGWTEKA